MASVQTINTLNHRIASIYKKFGEDSTIYKKTVEDLYATFGSENITYSKKTGVARIKESKANIENELGLKGVNKRVQSPSQVMKEAKKRFESAKGRRPSDDSELKDFVNTVYLFNDFLDQHRNEIYAAEKSGAPEAANILQVLNKSNKTYEDLQVVINLYKKLFSTDEWEYMADEEIDSYL